jgi:hypothetical protein
MELKIDKDGRVYMGISIDEVLLLRGTNTPEDNGVYHSELGASIYHFDESSESKS